MRYFKLLKDLPDIKAGTINVENYGDNYIFGSIKSIHYLYDIKRIKNNPEWFEEVWKCEMCNKYRKKNDYNETLHEPMCDECFNKNKKGKKIVKIEPLKELGFCKMNSNKINEIIEKIND